MKSVWVTRCLTISILLNLWAFFVLFFGWQ
jgi:hypothetical protein